MFLDIWKKMSTKPGGKWLFSKMVGWKAPYTGSVGGVVQELAPGYAIICLKERRAIQNHLRSVHAVALMNVAEMASGLAMLAGLNDDIRGIVTKFQIEYLKKARGVLTARGWCEVPVVRGKTSSESHVEIMNARGEIVARATATWLLDLQAKDA